MKLVVCDPATVLFATGEVMPADIVPSAGTGRALVVVHPGTAHARYVTAAEAVREGLGIQDATDRELAMLTASGYRLPVVPGPVG